MESWSVTRDMSAEPIPKAFCWRHTAYYQVEEQHERSIDERFRQAADQKEGYHWNREWRAEEHCTGRAFQTPMLWQFHRQLAGCHCGILPISKEAVYQCTKDFRYTTYFILNLPNSRYLHPRTEIVRLHVGEPIAEADWVSQTCCHCDPEFIRFTGRFSMVATGETGHGHEQKRRAYKIDGLLLCGEVFFFA